MPDVPGNAHHQPAGVGSKNRRATCFQHLCNDNVWVVAEYIVTGLGQGHEDTCLATGHYKDRPKFAP